MIRYVLAIVLTAAVLGLTGAALDHASAVRGERAIETEITTVEAAATSLVEEETAPTGAATPRRTVELSIPEDGITIDGTEQFRFEPVPAAGATRVQYKLSDGTETTATLDVVLGRADGGALDLSDRRGTVRLRLARDSADGEAIVEATIV